MGIGKYGRPLPVVYIPKVGGRKTVKVDPSKFCHCLRKIGDVDGDNGGIGNLSWSYDNEEIIPKKKKKKKGKEIVDIVAANDCEELSEKILNNANTSCVDTDIGESNSPK